MRLIDADILKDECERIHDEYPREHQGIEMLLAIDKAKPIDAVIVTHGYWYPYEPEIGYYGCSICDHRILKAQCNYCPKCGAKMDIRVTGVDLCHATDS